LNADGSPKIYIYGRASDASARASLTAWSAEKSGGSNTNCTGGILSDLEALAIKRFKNGLGIGFVESWIPQVNDDKGAPLHSTAFLGAFGIGPIVTYSTKVRKSHLDFSSRWIHDFDVSNRVAGDGFNFSASLKF